MSVSGACYCEENAVGPDDIKVIIGAVSGIDWVNSSLTIERIVDLVHDSMTFAVPNGARIFRGTDTIMFSDVEMWDNVKVEYYNDAPIGGLKVVSIEVVS